MMKQPFDIATTLDMPTLPQELARVEQRLAACQAQMISPMIRGPLQRVLGAKGKRLRPSLVIAVAAHFSGGVNDTAIHAATALELAHIASLVHDDIIDHASSRHGVPTINHVEGNDHALLAGDVLFAKACGEGAQASAAVGEAVANAIIKLCDGESQEVVSEQNTARSEADMLQAIAGKTSALFATAAHVGGLCGGASSAQVAALNTYGHKLGLAFQLIDDLLDLLSTEDLSGKPVGNDIREGVYTLPIIRALAGPHANQIRAWLNTPDTLPYSELVTLLMQEGHIEYTLKLAHTYNREATAAMHEAGGSEALAALPAAYASWALQNQTAPAHRAALAAMS